MKNKIRSAKGVLVDFDLLAIKDQISQTHPTTTVKLRQDFIERKQKRRTRKALNIAVDVLGAEKTDDGSINDSKLPSTETPKKATKQKARVKKTNEQPKSD